MSNEKTLGQVYSEAMDDAKDMRGVVTWADRYAAGIAAVCRHIIDEQMAKHEKECHRLRPPVVKCDDDEPPKPEAASEGDWAMEAWLVACDKWRSTSSYGESEKPERQHSDNIAAAKVIREAAERHYGTAFRQEVERTAQAIQERDAASERVKELELLLLNERQCIEESYRERDAALAECERLRAECTARSASLGMAITVAEALADERDATRPAATPATPASPAATCDDELRKVVEAVLHGYSVYGPTDFLSLKVIAAIRPLFDAVRAERDEAIKAVECHKSYHDTEQAVKRAEAAEAERDKLAAELREVREACRWVDENSIWLGNTGRARWACGQQYGNELLNTILTAFRATKGKEPTA